MPLDGLTLHVLVKELEPLLKNSRVLKIYQPDQTTITFQLRLPGKTKILLISADAVLPRIHSTQQQPPNPLNPPSFCMLLRKYLEPSRLIRIEQQGYDRIIHLYFEALDEFGKPWELTLIFEVMGRQSNLYLVNQDGIILDALKRFPDRGVFAGKPYVAPSDQGKVQPTAFTKEQFVNELRLLPAPTKIWRWITSTFQGFSKVAAQEVLLRSGFAPSAKRSDLQEEDWTRLQLGFQDLLDELAKGGTPSLYSEEQEDFTAYKLTGKHGQPFASTNHLLGDVLDRRQREKQVEELKSLLKRQLNRHRKRVAKKEAIQQTALQEADQADLYRYKGELLTANYHLIAEGASTVEVPDYLQEGHPLVEIELDPQLSPSKNVARIFKRYRKAQASQKHTTAQLRKTLAERRYLDDILSQIDLADQTSILKEIESELQSAGYIKRQRKVRSSKSQAPQRPERYLSTDGYTILVGRNNRQNDELTFGLMSPNHLWLHARNIPGSHVGILAEGEIPQDTLVQAATLAAYFSQSRWSPKVDVDHTLRKHVRKPRGAKPGFVHYTEAKTITVNPTESELPPKQK